MARGPSQQTPTSTHTHRCLLLHGNFSFAQFFSSSLIFVFFITMVSVLVYGRENPPQPSSSSSVQPARDDESRLHQHLKPASHNNRSQKKSFFFRGCRRFEICVYYFFLTSLSLANVENFFLTFETVEFPSCHRSVQTLGSWPLFWDFY